MHLQRLVESSVIRSARLGQWQDDPYSLIAMSNFFPPGAREKGLALKNAYLRLGWFPLSS